MQVDKQAFQAATSKLERDTHIVLFRKHEGDERWLYYATCQRSSATQLFEEARIYYESGPGCMGKARAPISDEGAAALRRVLDGD